LNTAPKTKKRDQLFTRPPETQNAAAQPAATTSVMDLEKA
jgi:hypothetical protein